MKARFLIGAPQSGGGKTTFTMGLLRALQRRGCVVQPFKCGPDYIDPMYHQWACGRISVNLDRWLQSEKHLQHVFARYANEADVCVTEGVMGLFDGFDRMRGSSAEIALALKMPVVLVVNARSTAYSIAPLIYGYRHFNADIHLAGVVFNQVGSSDQYAMLRKACEDVDVECLGFVPRMKDIEIPSRHLGLTLDADIQVERLIDRMADALEQTLDIDRLLKKTSLPEDKFERMYPCGRAKAGKAREPMKTAVARDEAFNFIYEENLLSLKERGEVEFFSPMKDTVLPEGIDLLYLPGGYPEFYLKQLAENKSMRDAVKEYAERGGKILAECGGMMYLCRCIVGMDEAIYPMAGVLPMDATMKDMHLTLGYRKTRIGREDWYGHEFHYSHILDDSEAERMGEQWNARGQKVDTTIFKWKNVRAGYTHWYWAERDILKLWDE